MIAGKTKLLLKSNNIALNELNFKKCVTSVNHYFNEGAKLICVNIVRPALL